MVGHGPLSERMYKALCIVLTNNYGLVLKNSETGEFQFFESKDATLHKLFIIYSLDNLRRIISSAISSGFTIIASGLCHVLLKLIEVNTKLFRKTLLMIKCSNSQSS